MDRVVVVGGSMGGLRAAEAVARTGYGGEIVVVGDEPMMPYNRPPLSKDALRDGFDDDDLVFRIPRRAADVVWRLGTRVTSADLDQRTVSTGDGERLAWSGLVIATGLRPRRLGLPGPRAGRFVVRTVADAAALRSALLGAERAVIVGAGFIGCEVAATARALGVETHVVAPEPVPMDRPLGVELGAALRRRHEAAGVRFWLGTVPVAYLGEDRVTGVRLSEGTELPADFVVEAVGCVPAVRWLEGNGLDLSDGVLCDGLLRVEGRPEVVACGDLARFPNASVDEVPRRVEHWTMVADTARRAGTSLGRHLSGQEADDTPFGPVASFWSDQYALRIQSFGMVGVGDDVRMLEGDLDDEAAVGYYREDRLVGVVLLGLKSRYLHYRQLVAESGEAG